MKSLASQALDRLGKQWDLGKLTREAHLQHTRDFAGFVSEKFGLEDIRNLKPGHVQGYIDHLKAEGLGNGTVCNRLAAIRDLAQALGKANIVERENEAYGVNRGSRQSPIVQNTELVNQIRMTLADRANNGDRIAMMVHAAAELRDAFGLRAKESLMSFQIIDIATGAALQIERFDAREKGYKDGQLRVEGAKTGRVRLLPIENETQAHAVVQAHLVAKALNSGTGRIMPPELSLKQALNAQRSLWAKLGGTKANGAHMHASRHKVAQEMHKRGYSKGEIMQRLGHGEDRSPFCYIPR